MSASDAVAIVEELNVPTAGVDMVVVDYRSRPHLQAFAQSVVGCLGELPMELGIVLVDEPQSNAEDLCGELAGAFPYEKCPLRIWATPYNTGYGVACNEMAQWGSHDTLAFFNSDTELTPGLLNSCRDLLWSDPAVGVVGPKQVDRRRRITHAGIFGTHQQPRHRGWQAYDMPNKFVDVSEAVSVAGSMYFIKRHVFEELTACPIFQAVAPGANGAFLPTFLYFEETWISYHAAAHGYKVMYNGQASGIHRWHGSIGAKNPYEQQWFKDSKRLFVQACEAHGIPHD